MKIEVQTDWYSQEMCLNNKNKIYVFGDNTMRVGMGGQAQVRGCSNAIGVATKKSPSMDDDSFFDDSFLSLDYLLKDLHKLHWYHTNEAYDNMIMIFPKDGLGTGLSQLSTRAPFINKQLCLLLEHFFGVLTAEDGTLYLKDS